MGSYFPLIEDCIRFNIVTPVKHIVFLVIVNINVYLLAIEVHYGHMFSAQHAYVITYLLTISLFTVIYCIRYVYYCVPYP